MTDGAGATDTITINIGAVTLPQLSTPTGLAWGTGENEGIASWNAVAGAESYYVEIRRSTHSVLSTYSYIATTSVDLRAVIAAEGAESFYFTVSAEGDGVSTADSETARSESFTYSPTTVTFNTLVAANGSRTASTTALNFTLSADVALTADDIYVTGASKGALTKNGRSYTLSISDITVGDLESVTVALSKYGYAFSPASRTAPVRSIPAGSVMLVETTAPSTATYYTSHEAGWNAAVAANTATVTLIADWTADATSHAFGASGGGAGFAAAGSILVASDKTITLDLNGKKINRGLSTAVSGGNVLSVLGMLNIMDSAGGGIVMGGFNAGDGGGVTVSGGILELSGGSISDNVAANGGGVYVATGELLTSGAAMICGNTATLYGGGVYFSGSRLRLAGNSTVNDNEAAGGGGIYQNGGFAEFSGLASITGNDATSYGGGGVALNGGTFETWSNAVISGNTANTTGGGIDITGSGRLALSGGSIASNRASDGGGGVNLAASENSALNVSGDAWVIGNYKGTGSGRTADNIRLEDGMLITVSAALTDDAGFGVNLETPPAAGVPVAITGANGSSAYASYFTSDSEGLETYDDGEASALTVKLRVPLTKLFTPMNPAWGTGENEWRATWSAVTNASGYAIQLYRDGTASANAVGEFLTTGTSIDLRTSLEAIGVGVYYFSVRAVGDGALYSDSDDSAIGAGFAYFEPTLNESGLSIYGNGIPLYISEALNIDVPTTYVCSGDYYGESGAVLVTSWPSDYTTPSHYVYGGRASGDLTADTAIYMKGGTVYQIHAGNFSGVLTGSTTVEISGGAIDEVSGGGRTAAARVTGDATITISGNATYIAYTAPRTAPSAAIRPSRFGAAQ